MNSRLRFNVAGQAPHPVDMVEHIEMANESHWLVVRNVATEVVRLVSAKIDE